MGESDALYTDILAELECPICTHYMVPPIRQCETGHSLCEPCMKKLWLCPICQRKFTNAKNISLQALAYKVPYPCINALLGCTAKPKLEQRKNHEKNCFFRAFNCAVESCTWTGTLQDIKSHWTSKCKPIRSSNTVYRNLTMKANTCFINLAEAYNRLFWVKGKVDVERIYWSVQLIGHDADEATNYCYEIDIYDSEISERRIILKDYCKSIKIDNSDLFSEDMCITTVSRGRIKRFINKFHTAYSLRILKTRK